MRQSHSAASGEPCHKHWAFVEDQFGIQPMSPVLADAPSQMAPRPVRRRHCVRRSTRPRHSRGRRVPDPTEFLELHRSAHGSTPTRARHGDPIGTCLLRKCVPPARHVEMPGPRHLGSQWRAGEHETRRGERHHEDRRYTPRRHHDDSCLRRGVRPKAKPQGAPLADDQRTLIQATWLDSMSVQVT